MENLSTPNELRVAALQNSPAFGALYRGAPASLRFKGQTHYRDAAMSVQEKLWYLSALSFVDPNALYALTQQAPSAYQLDADDSELVAAKRAQKECEQKLKALGVKRINQLALIKQAIDAGNKCGEGDGGFAAVFTGGISLAACKAEHHVARSQREGILAQIDIDITTAKEACRAAAEDVADAQAKYNEENRKIRAQEEKDRLQALAEERAEAQKRRDEAAAANAERRRADAEAAAAERERRAQEQSDYEAANQPDPSSWNPADYPTFGEEDYSGDYDDDGGDDWGSGDVDDTYWMDAVAAGVFGDDEATERALYLQGETPPRFSSSPWGYDTFYACDGCANYDAAEGEAFGCDDDGQCEACSGYGLDQDGLTFYGAEGEGVMAIVAGVLAIAPSVINAFTAPSGGATGNTTKEVTDKILKETGVQDKIDAAAAREGEKARNWILLAAAGIGALVIKFA